MASRINLNLTDNYAPSWKIWEGMRELVQNWHDGILESVELDKGSTFQHECNGRNRIHFEKTEDNNTIVYNAIINRKNLNCITGSIFYYKSQEKVIFVNSQTELHRRVLLMGYSKKIHSSDVIGQFGEGLKVGALALIRQGRAVSMVTSNDWWEFELADDPVYGETVLSVDVRKRNEATFYDISCFDESLSNSKYLNDFSSCVDSTFTVVSRITADEWSSFCNKILFLEAPRDNESVETELGTLLLRNTYKGQLFVKGVWVSDLSKDGLETGVNFYNLRIDRDRRAVIHYSDIDHQVSSMWVKAMEKHPELAERYFHLLNKNTASDIKHSGFYLKDSMCLEAIRSQFCQVYGEDTYPVSADISAEKLLKLKQQVQNKIVVLNQNLVNILYSTGKFVSLEELMIQDKQPNRKQYVPVHALSRREISILMHSQNLLKIVDPTLSISSYDIVASNEDKVEVNISLDNHKMIEIPRCLLSNERVHVLMTKCHEKDNCMCCESIIMLKVMDKLPHDIMLDWIGVNKNVFTLVASLSQQVCGMSPPYCKDLHEDDGDKWNKEHVLCIEKEKLLQTEIQNLKIKAEETEREHIKDYRKLKGMITNLEKELNHQEIEKVNMEETINEGWRKQLQMLKSDHQIAVRQLEKDISRQKEEYQTYRISFKKEIAYLQSCCQDLESKELEKSRAFARHQQTSRERISTYRKLLGQRLQQCYSVVKSGETGDQPTKAMDDILEEFRSIEDKDLCLVCVSESRNCTLSPCGHHILCFGCANALLSCPVCRQEIGSRIKTYS